MQPYIIIFDGHYDYLAMKIENFMRSKEMWSLVDEGIPTPIIGTSSPNLAQRNMVGGAKLRNLKVKNYPFQEIDRQILETIIDKVTSKAI